MTTIKISSKRLNDEDVRPDEDAADVADVERSALLNDELSDEERKESQLFDRFLRIKQQALEELDRRRQVQADELKAYYAISNRMFCRSCGILVIRKDTEDNVMWSKRRRCDTCISNKVQTDARHCRHCGVAIDRAKYLAKKGNNLLGWNTVARCEGCTDAVAQMKKQAQSS